MDLARLKKCLSVPFGLGSSLPGRERGRDMATESGSLLPLMVLRAHLLALCLSLSLSVSRSLFSGHCHIPLRNVIFLVSLSRSLAGFTTQFEDSPYRAPSSTLLVPEYSENSGAADRRRRTRGQHMSTEFLRDPRNERGILNPGKLPVMLTRSCTPDALSWSLENPVRTSKLRDEGPGPDPD